MTAPLLIMMCGPSCAGKTTVARRLADIFDAVRLSTDDIIEAEAKRRGKAYSDIFDGYIGMAQGIHNARVGEALKMRLNLLIDRTHTTVASRRKVLSRVPVAYSKLAVVVGLDLSVSELLERCERRVAGGGIDVPGHVIARMHNDFRREQPTLDEGFDTILHVSKHDTRREA